MKRIFIQNSILYALILLVALFFPKNGNSQKFHSDKDLARDCYYLIYFGKDWKPLFLREGQILSGGGYKWISENESAFKHEFCDFDTAHYYRFIYLKRLEVLNYINNQQTSVSENKTMDDFFTLFIKGQGSFFAKQQFRAQRCTFMGLNSQGLDSINTEGIRYWLDKNGTCTKEDYYRTYENYELISNVYGNEENCDKQNRSYSYSWRKDGKEILFVFAHKMEKAVFLRRPDSDTCLAAYFIVKNNGTTYQPSTHWVVGDFKYLTNRYFGGDPVQANGNANSDVTGDFLKAYIRDYPGTLLFPLHYTSLWKSLIPDVSLWYKIPKIETKMLEDNWNSQDLNKIVGKIANQIGQEYLNDGGYWSAEFSKSGKKCNTGFSEDIY